MQEALGGPLRVFEAKSPVLEAKTIKNSVEIQCFRECHIQDAAALCKFFAWLENELVTHQKTDITEVDAADKLESFRMFIFLFKF